jgi:cytochrome P450
MTDSQRIVRDEASGSFILFGYKDAREILGDNTLWKDPDRAEPAATLLKSFKPGPAEPDRNASILWLDGEEHARVRGPFAKAFLRRVAAARGDTERMVDDRLDVLVQKGRFDAITEFATQIPKDVILRFIGADGADLPRIRPWAETLNMMFKPQRTAGDEREMAAAMKSFGGYIDGLIAERRRLPRDDLISDVVHMPEARLSPSELRINCVGLVTGGVLTTADLIGNAIWLLLAHASAREALLEEPALIGHAIEEVLRFAPPVEGAQRVASRELAFGTCPIAESQVVVAWIPSANRDPATFQDAEQFDISRKRAPHLSFGGGAHICIGAPLARLEAQIAVLKLLQRFPSLRLADPAAPLKWRPTPFFHGLEELIVTTG